MPRRDVDGSRHRETHETRNEDHRAPCRYIGWSCSDRDCCGLCCCACSSRGFQCAVDGRPGHAELGGDRRHRVAPFAVLAEFVVHLPGEFDLARAQFGLLAAGAPAGPRRRQAVPGALGHQRVLELGERAEDLEEHPAHRGGRVDALVEHHQVHTALPESGGQGDQVRQGPTEPVELGHRELITVAQDEERLVELGAAGELAAHLVDVDMVPLASCREQRVVLCLWVLVPR